MKYLKKFESKSKDKTPLDYLIEYRDDMVKVLTKYYQTHTGDLCEQIDDMIWDSSVDVSNYEETGEISKEFMGEVIDDYKESWPNRIQKILDIYYDCLEFVDSIDEDMEEKIKEVFYEYSDSSRTSINKTSKHNDNRYAVRIEVKDAFLKVNFEEVLNRISDLEFNEYSIEGGKDYIIIEFWKPLVKEINRISIE